MTLPTSGVIVNGDRTIDHDACANNGKRLTEGGTSEEELDRCKKHPRLDENAELAGKDETEGITIDVESSVEDKNANREGFDHEVSRTWWSSSVDSFLTKKLIDVHDRLSATSEFDALCKECLVELKAACSNALSAHEFRVEPFDWTPDVQLETFGSTRSGTALLSSDLDVRMTFEQFEVHDKQRQIKYLKGIRDNPGSRFTILQFIEDARLPLLRLLFDEKLPVDLSMGGGMALNEDSRGVDEPLANILHSAIDPKVAYSFVRLVKIWSKSQNLVDASEGLPSSTTWTCLAIVFLQTQGCLLSGQEVDEPSEYPPRQLWPIIINGSLFGRFLQFVAHCGSNSAKVSVCRGFWRRRKNYTWSGKLAEPLVLEHPCPSHKDKNIAISLQWPGWTRVATACREGRRHLLPVGIALSCSAEQAEAIDRGIDRLLSREQKET